MTFIPIKLFSYRFTRSLNLGAETWVLARVRYRSIRLKTCQTEELFLCRLESGSQIETESARSSLAQQVAVTRAYSTLSQPNNISQHSSPACLYDCTSKTCSDISPRVIIRRDNRKIIIFGLAIQRVACLKLNTKL